MIKVLVIDDSKLIYEGLQAIFAVDEEIAIVGHAKNGKEAIEQIANSKHQPDVVLVDLLMPVMGGVETTKEISRLFPEIKTIVLSSFEDNPPIVEAIAAGAKGYLLKNMLVRDLTAAIRSVNRGSAHFAPEIIDSLAKNVQKNYPLGEPNTSKSKQIKTKKAVVKNATKVKQKSPQPLFQHGDWLTVIIGAIALCCTDGMGHHLAHAGLFLLMLSLIARPIKVWWKWPLLHRRAIGVVAFAAAVAHAFYATFKILKLDLSVILALPAQSKWGIVMGIISLLAMTPAAVTSFQFFQQKLGKKWRQIHLLTVPALVFAIPHTIIVGPHYMAALQINTIDYVRIFAVIVAGTLVFLMREKFFWSTLGLNKVKK